MSRKYGPNDTTSHETVSQRVGRFALLLGLIFAIVVAVVVAQRFSTDTLALIAGLVLGGALLASPLLAIAWVFVAVKTRSQPRQMYPPYQMPPVIIQQPQQPLLPHYGQPWLPPQHQPRSWDVIGND